MCLCRKKIQYKKIIGDVVKIIFRGRFRVIWQFLSKRYKLYECLKV